MTLSEHDSSRLSEPEGKFDCDVSVSETADPVGSEQTRHYSSIQLPRAA
jgi:hypothetical protein